MKEPKLSKRLDKQFGVQLNRLLIEKKITNYEMAKWIGTDTGHIGRICKKTALVKTGIKIIEALKARNIDTSCLEVFLQPVEQKKFPEIKDSTTSTLPANTNIDPGFVGRRETIARLLKIVEDGHKMIEIQAKGGVGKTTVTDELVKSLRAKSEFEFIHWIVCSERENATSAERLLEEWLKVLKVEPSQEFNISLNRLANVLSQKKVLIFIDNLEPVLDREGKFYPEFRGYVDIFKLLSSHKGLNSLTLVTTRESICEPLVAKRTFLLEKLSLEAWTEYFNYYQITVSPETLKRAYDFCGGNAKAMTLLCGEVKSEYDSDFDYFFGRVYRENLASHFELMALVSDQFNRLRNKDFQAYQLLIRLGCYQYKDIPKIESDGVFALLWDVKDQFKRHQIFESLKKRNLIEISRDKSQKNFWLHPIIREEALRRIQDDQDDYETANLKIAQYLDQISSEVKNKEEAVQAIEAHRHYIKARRKDLALNVITKERKTNAPAGVVLWRLGLSIGLLPELEKLLEIAKDEIFVYRLRMIIGDIFQLFGQPRCAIYYYLNASKDLQNIGEPQEGDKHEYERENYAININMSLCYLDLNDLDNARVYSDKSMNFIRSEALCGKLSVLLALKGLIYLKQGDKTSSQDCLDKAHHAHHDWLNSLNNEDMSTWLNKNVWSHTYYYLFSAEIFIYLEEENLANRLLEKASKFCDKNKFQQGYGKSLTLMGELYRVQKSYNEALESIYKALEILTEIEANADLAETYFYESLVYRDIHDLKKAKQSLAKAHEQYQKMDAPLQIERTNKLFQERN